MGFSIPLVDSATAKKRLDVCKGCPRYRKKTGTCNICNCIMKLKVKISKSSCPLGKF